MVVNSTAKKPVRCIMKAGGSVKVGGPMLIISRGKEKGCCSESSLLYIFSLAPCGLRNGVGQLHQTVCHIVVRTNGVISFLDVDNMHHENI